MFVKKSSYNPSLIVGKSPILKIRGIIANRDFKNGEVIEKCPVILVPKTQENALKQTVLWKYYYEWSHKFHCIVLGYGSLINHSYTPNTRYVFDYRNTLLVYKAIKTIKIGEEILVNYNFEPHSKTPLTPDLLDFNKHVPQ